MKIEESSPFMQVNAVAQRVRQLTLGSAARVKTNSRRPTAIALTELRAGKIEVYDPAEAEAILADPSESEEADPGAVEAAREGFEEIFDDAVPEPAAEEA